MNLLWIPHEPWIYPQRAKYFCMHLSKDFKIHFFDHISFTSVKEYFSKNLFKSWFYNQREEEGITIHRVPRLSPTIFSARLRSINHRIYDKYINRIVDENNIEVVISTSSVKPPKAKKLIFDIFDNNPAYWREFRNNNKLASEIEENEKKYIEVSDAIVVCSNVLKEKIDRESTLIPNGVDIERIRGGDKTKIVDKFDIEGKVIGFIGIHGEFSGLTKVVKAAYILKELDIHFLIAGDGSEVPKAMEIAKKYNLKNITFLGYIEEVSDFFSTIDIGLLPHKKSEFWDAGSPIKLFEYTVAKVPVVSTPAKEVIRLDFPNVLIVEDSPSKLAKGLEKAIDWEPRFPDMRKYEWKNLARDYKNVIER